MENREIFNADQIEIINRAVEMAEELVSNHFKMSANQWLRPKYDIKTMSELSPDEIVSGPFAQIIRYKGRHKNRLLGSSTYDFYKICLQDHSILSVLRQSEDLKLFPFLLYIVTHELIHIVRFSKFLQRFDASPDEKMQEETRVHKTAHEILITIRDEGMPDVMKFYNRWHQPLDELIDPW